jgi:large subunit ribosomal protein L9
VDVKDGYGCNFLVPRRMAVPVNPGNVRQVEEERRRLAAVDAKRRASLAELAEVLGKVSLTIQARANEEGHLFGSVGPEEVAAALKEENFDISPSMIALEKPVKQLGVFEVPIRLDSDLSSVVKVWVVGE